MPIPPSFVEWLERPSPSVIVKRIIDKTNPTGGFHWELRNEVRPIDLYCYLAARFGPPNGIQNFLRQDSSDNLFHWDWTLAYESGWVMIQGLNFRTEVIMLGDLPVVEEDRDDFIKQLKADFAKYGRQMSDFRTQVLEKWIEFVNPYFRLRNAVHQLRIELAELRLNPMQDRLPHLFEPGDSADIEKQWTEIGARYSKGLGICFGIRSMLPVMAEAFVNLMLFVLMRDDLGKDDRLRENATRQPIDVRIKTLHINCKGFLRQVDYAHDACRRYHTLVNDRNDLLHGNVAVSKLQFNEVYFNGKVPIFVDYKSMWDRSYGVEIRAAGLDKLDDEVKVVDDFIEYVLTCLEPRTREFIERAMNTRDLGINVQTGALGVLFSDVLIDVKMGPMSPRSGESYQETPPVETDEQSA